MSLSNAVRRRASGALAFLFGVCAAACALPAGAQSPAQPPDHAATPQVRVRLLAPVDAVHPGEQLLLGLEQQLEPGWHTYWTNPGDTGVPTRIDWTLPAGAHAGPIEWPVPTRFRTGPVTSYGYEHRVTLLSAVTVPADAKAGSTFPVRAKVSWLVCKDVCIPQQAELGLVLPVLAVGMPAGQGGLASGPARAALPDPLPAAARAGVQAATDGKAVALTLEGGPFTGEGLEDLWFYAEQRGRIAPGAAQVPRIEGSNGDKSGRIVLHLRAGEQPLAAGQRLGGILVLRKRTPAGSVTHGYRIEAALTASGAPIALPPLQAEEAAAPVSTAMPALPLGLPLAMLLALLGGAILNLMPCVFPVLSIKALSLLNHAQDGGGATARRHGIAYTLGVLASFALLGGVLILLKAGGAQVGWGFQFQSPPFVLGTAFLMFAVGLNLSGVFEVGASLAGIGSSLADRGGTTGSFFTGVLATVVATPCTAPFMGGAVAFALAQPPGVLLAVFLSMGAGLALPYLLLSSWPVLQRRLPRPGAWMERMRQALAFPMYATGVWLVWVLAQQGGVNAVPVALGGMVAIAFAAWLYGSTRLASPRPRRIGGAAAVVVAAAALGAGFTAIGAARPEGAGSASANAHADADAGGWTPYSAERLAQLRAQGRPVFVNLTASWCITCLVNEKVALRERSVTDAFRRAGIASLEGDWTNQDDRITALLSRFGRSGVPLYVYYPPGTASEPVVLPQLLTPDVVLAAIKVPAASTAALQNSE